METKKLHPATKGEALQIVGVASKKKRDAVGRHCEFILAEAGRHVVKRGHFANSLLVGVSGALRVRQSDGRETRIEAPFVLGSWVTDDRHIATVDAHAATEVALLVVDRRAHQAVAEQIPGLNRLAEQSHRLAKPPEATPQLDEPKLVPAGPVAHS